MCTVTKIGHEGDGNSDRRISTLCGGDGAGVYFVRKKDSAGLIEPRPVPECSDKSIGGRVMESKQKNQTNPLRSFAAGTRGTLLTVLAVCLGATLASAQIVLTGPAVTLGPLTGGGWFSGSSPMGGTFVVGANGNVIVGNGYGSTGVFEITPDGVESTLVGGIGNTESAGIDQYGNVYVSYDYNYGGVIYKLPFNASTGAYAGFTTAPTTSCSGGTLDAKACVFASGTQSLWPAENTGFTSFFFDGQGNFFFVSDTVPAANASSTPPGEPNTIYECPANSLPACSSPKLIYSDPHEIGAGAIDPWGNLFFVDGTIGGSSGNVTYLEELPFSGGAYASSPTAQLSYTDVNSGGYNGIAGVAVNGSGTVFFGVADDGVFALPNSSSGPTPAGIYKVSSEGAKGVTLDSKGNLYVVYSSNNNIVMTTLGNIGLGASAVGTASATAPTASVFDNAANCTTPPTLTYSVSENGVATSEFAAATSGLTCSTAVSASNGTFSPALASTGAVYTPALSFKPTIVGERSAAFTVTDSANSASGLATLSGVGQGALANLDPGVWTPYTSGFTTPYSVSVDAAGDLAVADEGGAVYWIPAGSAANATPTSIGSGFGEPAATAFDANGNLYIADFKDNQIDEIPNVAGVLKPGSQSILIADTVTFDGTALNKPSGLTVGPDGTLYISDLGNGRVVTYNPGSGNSSVFATGLKDPWGVAVDAANNVYIANTGGGNVLVYSAGVVTTLTPAGVTAPWGVVVDPSGSVLISDKGTGNIVRVPYDASATPAGLTDSEAFLVEKNPQSALGIALDAMGDLYTIDSTGAAVYAINRTAAAVSFGTVSDGTTSTPATVYVESAGNQTVTLGNPDVTEPANTMFTLGAASTNGCTIGTAGAPGQTCQFTGEFAPTIGASGAESGTATVSFSGSPSATVTLTGTATTSALKPQTITFAPPTTVYVGQQIMLSATGGGSGNPVTFSIDSGSACPGCATISGATLTAISAGAILVDANQAGNTSYAPAAQVQVAVTVKAQSAPGGPGSGILTSQLTWLGAYPTGGDENEGTSAGDSFGINSEGNILVSTTYGGTVIEVNGQTGAVITLGSYGEYGNTGGVAVDSNDNLYVGGLYGSGSNIIAKVPYLGGSALGGYAPLTDATQGTPPANCKGNDTAECVLAPLAAISGGFGVAAMKFDSQGNFFLVTSDQGNPHAIFECTVACLAGGTGAPAPVMLFQEPTGASPSTTGQLYLGDIAIDSTGNLFFTDSNQINPSGNGDESSYSDLYELPYTSGTGYAKTPVLLQTFTNATPGTYDDELNGVAVDPNGNVYYGIQYEGIFAFPNVSGTINTAGGYAVSTQGGKGLSYDANGTLYLTGYDNAVSGEAVARVSVSNVIMPVSPLSVTATLKNVTAMDNFVGCSTPATIDITSSDPQFSATAGSSCSSDTNSDGTGTALHPVAGSNFPVTVNFTPSAPGPQAATLTLTDTTNGGVSTAAISGTGQETAQTITITAPTTTTYTYGVAPITLAATGGASGNPVVFTVDKTSTGTATINGTTLTVTGAGSLVIDANQLGGLVSGVYYAAATQVQLTLTINTAGQTISFTAPASPVSFSNGLTIALIATGGGSASPVVFTVDTTSTGAGTISGSTLTVTGVGNLVIDANQAATTDYAAATQVQQTIQVNQGTQAITFTPPTGNTYFIVGGITINVVATGGGSGNAVVFNVDKTSTGVGTFAGNVLTVTAPGNLVIDANQAGTTNFLAAPQAQETIAVLSALPTQTITFNNPGTQVLGTPLTLAATATSGFTVAFTSSTTAVCTVAGTTATFVTAGTCTIVASQPGDNATFAAAPSVTQSFVVNATGMLPSFSFNLSLPSLTVQAGTVGITELTLNSVNSFAGTVSFACSGLPSGYNCSFNPNPITVLAGQSAVTTLSVGPSSTATAIHNGSRPLFPAATLAAALCLLGFKKRNRLQLLLLLIVSAAGLGLLSACGSSTSTSNKAASSTVTVTGTYGAQTASQTFTLIVE